MECCVWWNYSSSSVRAVGVVRRANKFCLLTFFQLRDAFIPSFDHLSLSYNKLQRLASIVAWVKNFSICEFASVMNFNFCTLWTNFTSSFVVFDYFKHSCITSLFLDVILRVIMVTRHSIVFMGMRMCRFRKLNPFLDKLPDLCAIILRHTTELLHQWTILHHVHLGHVRNLKIITNLKHLLRASVQCLNVRQCQRTWNWLCLHAT